MGSHKLLSIQIAVTKGGYYWSWALLKFQVRYRYGIVGVIYLGIGMELWGDIGMVLWGNLPRYPYGIMG